MRGLVVLVLTGAGFAAATPALAAPAAAKAPQTMQLFIAPSGQPFRAPPGKPYPVAQWFAQADTNHDGRVDSSEFVLDFMNFFDQLDLNGDGILDASEIAHYENDVAPEIRDSAEDRSRASRRRGSDSNFAEEDWEESGGSPRLPPHGAARFDLLGLSEPVSSMASDLNGDITRSAAESVATNRFLTLETNGLGYLTLKSLPETPAQRNDRHRHHG